MAHGDVVAYWLEMWWLIGEMWWLIREMWWLIGWRCGGSLVGDVVAHWEDVVGHLIFYYRKSAIQHPIANAYE